MTVPPKNPYVSAHYKCTAAGSCSTTVSSTGITMNPFPNVLIIGPTPPPFHGVAVAIQTLLTSSLSEKFQITHLDLADRRGIQYVNKPDMHDVFLFLRHFFRLIVILMRIRPTLTYLVLSQSTIGFLRDSFLLWPAYLSGSRAILHLHGGYFRDWFRGRSWLMKAYASAVLCRATRIIVLGDTFKGQFEGIVENAKVVVVSNGIDWKNTFSLPKPLHPNSRLQVLHLSTLSHLKGALVLIKAIPIILQHRRDIEFVCAGPWSHPEDEQWAQTFIAKQGIADHVRFTGQVDGAVKTSLFESADIFVFPGVQQEGQPLVVIEAMAAGIPVIFTNRGCLRDTVIHGESGIEVPINDPEELAKAILELINHPDTMKEMGCRARERYETCFTEDRHIQNITQVFSSAYTDTYP